MNSEFQCGTLGLPLDYLIELCDEVGQVHALGSAGAYWQIGTPAWCGRMDEVFNAPANALRCATSMGARSAHARTVSRAVADLPARTAQTSRKTSNVTLGCAECKAQPIDATNPPGLWSCATAAGGSDADFCHRHLYRCHGCSETFWFPRWVRPFTPANAFVLIGADLCDARLVARQDQPAAMGALDCQHRPADLPTQSGSRRDRGCLVGRFSPPPHWLTG